MNTGSWSEYSAYCDYERQVRRMEYELEVCDERADAETEGGAVADGAVGGG